MTDKNPGWDLKAINEIAKKCYGSLAKMYEKHNWSNQKPVIATKASVYIVKEYGSIEKFYEKHKDCLQS